MPETNIPLEAILKLQVEQSGAASVKDFLTDYIDKLKSGEESTKRTSDLWGQMADHVGRLDEHVKSLGGLFGIAGAGAVAQQFMAVSGSGAGVAMAEGHLTGNASTYGGYAHSLLGVQESTGVAYTQLEAGLRTVAQMAGGKLSPQGAARFGALLAGASLASGLSAQSVSSVLGSFLESTGMTEGYGTPGGTESATGLMAGVTQALSSFQGTQVGTMLPTVAGLYETQSLRSGPGGPHEGPAQTASFVNALAQTNPLFRNSKTVEAAIEGGNAYLLSGLTNPTTRFAEATAGISTSQAIEGGPEAIESLMESMRGRLPGETFRDWLRSTFPAATAKMGEELVAHPGLLREARRKGLEAAVRPNIGAYDESIHNSLASHTPGAELSELGAHALSLVESGEIGLSRAITPVGALIATGTVGGTLGHLAFAGTRALATGATDLGAGAMSSLGPAAAIGLAAYRDVKILAEPRSLESSIRAPQLEGFQNIPGARWLAQKATEGVGEGLHAVEGLGESALHALFGFKTSSENHAEELHAYHHALERRRQLAPLHSIGKELEKKFGEGWYEPHHGKMQKQIEAFVGQRLHGAGRQALDEEIGQMRKYKELGPEGYWQSKFGESVGKFDQAVEKFLHNGGATHKSTAYEGGASQHYASYDPLGAAATNAPAMVYADYLKMSGDKTAPGGPASAIPADYEQLTPSSSRGVAGQMMKFWEARGFSPAAAAGFVGNAYAESSLTPDEAGGGLYQQSGYPPSYGTGSVAEQSQRVNEHLSPALRKMLKNVKTPAEAARDIERFYERPEGSQPGEESKAAVAKLGEREEYAERVLREWLKEQKQTNAHLAKIHKTQKQRHTRHFPGKLV